MREGPELLTGVTCGERQLATDPVQVDPADAPDSPETPEAPERTEAPEAAEHVLDLLCRNTHPAHSSPSPSSPLSSLRVAERGSNLPSGVPDSEEGGVKGCVAGRARGVPGRQQGWGAVGSFQWGAWESTSLRMTSAILSTSAAPRPRSATISLATWRGVSLPSRKGKWMCCTAPVGPVLRRCTCTVPLDAAIAGAGYVCNLSLQVALLNKLSLYKLSL